LLLGVDVVEAGGDVGTNGVLLGDPVGDPVGDPDGDEVRLLLLALAASAASFATIPNCIGSVSNVSYKNFLLLSLPVGTANPLKL